MSTPVRTTFLGLAIAAFVACKGEPVGPPLDVSTTQGGGVSTDGIANPRRSAPPKHVGSSAGGERGAVPSGGGTSAQATWNGGTGGGLPATSAGGTGEAGRALEPRPQAGGGASPTSGPTPLSSECVLGDAALGTCSLD